MDIFFVNIIDGYFLHYDNANTFLQNGGVQHKEEKKEDKNGIEQDHHHLFTKTSTNANLLECENFLHLAS